MMSNVVGKTPRRSTCNNYYILANTNHVNRSGTTPQIYYGLAILVSSSSSTSSSSLTSRNLYVYANASSNVQKHYSSISCSLKRCASGAIMYL